MTEAFGRTAIVTGAGRGIGAGIARRLAADGMAVGVLDIEAEACAGTVSAITQAGGRALAVAADVAREKSVAAAVAAVAAELGPPTVVVNNAGVTRDNLLFKMSVDDWDTVMAVHLRGSFLVTRAAQAYMVEAKWGRIVNLSSTASLGNRGQSNYSTAKAGLQGLTKTFAIELGASAFPSRSSRPGWRAIPRSDGSGTRMTSRILRPSWSARAQGMSPGRSSTWRAVLGSERESLAARPRRCGYRLSREPRNTGRRFSRKAAIPSA